MSRLLTILLVAVGTQDLLAQPPALRLKAQTVKLGGHDTLVVLNNCDDSDRDGKADNYDPFVNGPADWLQLEEIRIEGTPGPGPVVLRLLKTGDDPFAFRIFKVTQRNADGTPQAAEMIIGPVARRFQEHYELKQDDLDLLAAGRLSLYIEGLDFAYAGQLAIEHSGGSQKDMLRLRVAPLVLLPHTQTPLLNMVVQTQHPQSPRYNKDFLLHCTTAKVQPLRVIHDWDVWIEDEMQWGHTEAPRAQLPVVLHTARIRGLADKVKALIAPGVGYYPLYQHAQDSHLLFQKPMKRDYSLFYGGNIEVAPPTAQHPFGRVYIGSKAGPAADYLGVNYARRTMNRQYVDFFARQGLQPPIELWSDWLDVGHTDEVVSFIPTPKAKKGFVMALASPRRGLKLLDIDNLMAQPDKERLLHAYFVRDFNLHRIEHLKNEPQINRMTFLGHGVERYNELVHGKIFGTDFNDAPTGLQEPKSIKQEFMDGLGLDPSDIIEVPTVFGNVRTGFREWKAVALTPGVVNLSSMGPYCMMSDPFIPSFRKDIEATLRPLGQAPLFIDNWDLYHINLGEVHCGSNMQRQGFTLKWWTVAK